MPARHQLVLKHQLTRLAEATKQQTISAEDCEAVIQEIRVAVIEYSLCEGLARDYIDHSTLSDSEKLAAGQSARRYAAAFCSGSINEETAMAIESRTVEFDVSGGQRFREVLPDDELRGLLAAMDEAANDAGVAAKLPPVDIAADVRKIVDRQLQMR